ncbi:MAG: hypothetical protein ACRETQ_10950 [Gammaproteobacteria bacterium]
MHKNIPLRLIAILVLSAALPLAARAAGFDYTYAEGGYLNASPSHGSSLSGAFVDGSYALQPNWHVGAAFSSASCCSITDNRLAAGFGYNASIAENLDFIADADFLNENVSGGNGSHSGWSIDGGLRARIAPQFELDGLVTHADINSDTENTLTIRGLYSLTTNWRLMASFSNNSDENDFMLGVRYAF